MNLLSVFGGKCTREQAAGLLWHCTAFPVINADEVERQLKKVKMQSGGDYEKAMAAAESKIEQAMEGEQK